MAVRKAAGALLRQLPARTLEATSRGFVACREGTNDPARTYLPPSLWLTRELLLLEVGLGTSVPAQDHHNPFSNCDFQGLRNETRHNQPDIGPGERRRSQDSQQWTSIIPFTRRIYPALISLQHVRLPLASSGTASLTEEQTDCQPCLPRKCSKTWTMTSRATSQQA